MPVSEHPERRKLRTVLRTIKNRVKQLELRGFDSEKWELYDIKVQHIDLDEKSSSGPIFFTPCSASLLVNLDDYDRNHERFKDYDPAIPEHYTAPINRARRLTGYFVHYTCVCVWFRRDKALDGLWSGVSIGDKPFLGLHQFGIPQSITRCADEVKDGSHPHIKAMMYTELDGSNDLILQSEVMVALRLSIAQLRRTRFMKHMTAPVLIFSFMGPQHVRLIEAYFKDRSLVVRPSRLFDLRKKDEDAIRTLAQWWFAKPTGNTSGKK